MSDAARRLSRLLELLPRVYAAQPAGSAVGTLLDALAQALGRFDTDARRVLHDRWVALAGTEPGSEDEAALSALERLGALLRIERLPARLRHAGATAQADGSVSVRFDAPAERDDALQLLGVMLPLGDFPLPVPRLPGLSLRLDDGDELRWRFAPLQAAAGDGSAEADDPTAEGAADADPLAALWRLLRPEAGEAYRQRLQITQAIRQGGLATPRALLSLAIADLGAEPCPKFRRDRNATLARALPPGRRKRCPACGDPSQPCPQPALFEPWLNEQPAHSARWQGRDLRLRRFFTLRNDSLVADRPQLELAVDRAVSFPALQSRASGEIVLYAGDLEPGWTLRLAPQLSAEEDAALASYERPTPHPWLLRSPRGRAELVQAQSGQVRDVSAAIYYLRGSRLGGPNAETAEPEGPKFGGVGIEADECMRFGVLEAAVRTPLLTPGDNEWSLLTFPSPVYRFDAATSRLAASEQDSGAHFSLIDPGIGDASAAFAKTLFEVLERADPASAGDGPNAPRFTLALRWVTREPFSFVLNLPANGWVETAKLSGAVELLLADVERARPAGTRARVDFPAPVLREAQPLDEALAAFGVGLRHQEAMALQDALVSVKLGQTLREPASAGEVGLSIGAVFDVARLASGASPAAAAAGDRIELRSTWQ
ncbi:hypothetical protein [Azohydromonas caseinilytica]|uniref:Uncharacterized protein n=1 Tax=Azohydromonas caseinilytica TaxID=2728836 RepID=A0A848F506_9BURK|nr:hypothetical protein [Azohydromonas caseinilytica]NML13689.1 hypothetical protein [Azohydromonas caseinilytica]